MATESERVADLVFGDFRIDRSDERVIGPGGPVRLGNKAYRVLLALIEQDGRLLTKDALFSTVWDGTIVGESALTSTIKELRRALGDESKTPQYVESVYGRGYRFIAPVRRDDVGNRDTTVPPVPAPAALRPELSGDEGRPPIILVAEFNDDAVRARHPHRAAELREEILSGLARFREIQLIAEERSAPAGFGGNVRGYRLSATLLGDGDGVKIAARANRLADGRIVWAETLSLADTGAAGGVEKIVRRIVGSALPAVDQDIFLGLPRTGGDFYDRYLIAKRRSLTATDFAEAKAAAAELEALIAERRDFALAYPPLVRLYNTDFGFTGLGASGAAERDRALALARTGLAADRGNVHAFTVLGFCCLYHGEEELPRSCFEQALALNPYNPVRLNEVAAGMIYLGDFARGRALLDMSLQLHPFPDDSFLEDSGRLKFLEGDCDGARTALESIARPSIWSEFYLALCEREAGGAGSGDRFDNWLDRVRRGWHDGNVPADAEVSAWVRRHQPFRGDAGKRLFDGVDAALRPAKPRPAPRSPGATRG